MSWKHHVAFAALFLSFFTPFQSVACLYLTNPSDSLQKMEQRIGKRIDAWHRAAATADSVSYFAFMSSDCRFLGTDPAEDWDKASFFNAVKSAFDKAPAWDYIASERHFKWIIPGKVVHFYEKLDTWMGACRGSGLVENFNGTWKITFYNLANTIPNAIVDEYVPFYEAKTGLPVRK